MLQHDLGEFFMFDGPDVENKKHFWIALSLIILTGILIRLCVILFIPTVPTEDFWSYFQRAISLADRGVYEATKGYPDAPYPPGYPLLLSLFFKLPFDRILVAKVINVLLSACGLFFTSEIARLLFSRKAALIAGVIYAFYPRSILSCALIASENLFIPLILLWINLIIQSDAGIRIKYSFRNGLVLGAATLTRSISWLFSLPWIIYQMVKKVPIRQMVINFVVLIITQMLVLLPWAIRNARILGTGTFLTTTSGINLFIGNNSNASGQWYYWPVDIEKVVPDFLSQSVAKQNQIAGKLAKEWIIQHPFEAFKLYCKKWGLMFVNDHFALETAIFAKQLSPPWPAVDVLKDNSLFIPYQKALYVLFDYYYWIFLILGTLGAFLLLIKNHRSRVFLSKWSLVFLSALYFPTMSAIFLASSRFHWPTTDLMIPFAAGLLAFLFPRKMKKSLTGNYFGFQEE
jgi:hypothetical protein